MPTIYSEGIINPLWLPLPVLIPLWLALAAWGLRHDPRWSRRLLALGTLAMLLVALGLFCFVHGLPGPARMDFGGWERPVGISFQVDLYSAIMVLVATLVGFTGALYAGAEIGKSTWRRGYGCFYFLLMAGIQGAFMTNDLFNLYVWFEVMLMASFAMLVLGRRRYVFEGATKYVVINMVSSIFFLTGLGILYGKTGQLNLDELAIRLAASDAGSVIMSSASLLLLAFGIKAGVFPLYFWLPPAYPHTGFATAAVFGGLLTKVGVYALFRVFGGALRFMGEFTGPLFIWVGVATMVAGVLGAASQFHTRRILSFHIISQIGYIVLGLGLFTQGALAAAIFYTVHHILVKTNLFLAAGIIATSGRTESLHRLGGLLKQEPMLAILFLIPALSLGGIPPLSGFFAKFLLVREAFRAGAWWPGGIALLVGVLTLYSMTKIWAEAFWKDSPRTQGTTRIRRVQYIPVALLAACTVVIGLFVGPVYRLSERAAEQLSAPASPMGAPIPGDHSP